MSMSAAALTRGAVVRPIGQVSLGDLAEVGGKGANLGELVRGGFPVPDGVVLTTAAYEAAAAAAHVDPAKPEDAAERLRNEPVTEPIASAIREAYAALGQGPVAVRSSATGEDLPGASFAGQQDSYLNVVGEDALLDAVRRCWASLWNQRAVAYRRERDIDDSRVGLAVVVQRMVPASAAGVMFTADPLTGTRHLVAIEAIAGLGERLVSGAANPDHYRVEAANRRILERRPASVEAVLEDNELLELGALGGAVERRFGAPQDIEFALDEQRHVWLVQSRPITTLFPLPAGTPDSQSELRVYFSANVVQGYFEPLTPMGVQFFRLLGAAVTQAFGSPVRDPGGGPGFLVEAGMRLFIDITPILRNPFGRRAFAVVSSMGEARSAAVVGRLSADPRLMLRPEPPRRTLARLARAVLRAGLPSAALRVLGAPDAMRRRYVRQMEEIARIRLSTDATPTMRLDAFEYLVLTVLPRVLPRLLGIMAAAMMTLGLVRYLLRGVAREDELQTLTLSAPHNPTTEMDLALWSLSVNIRGDPPSHSALLEQTPADLAAAYAAQMLPAPLQSGLAAFLGRYGFRSIGEIDIGVPRWSENPAHLFGVLANYIRVTDSALSPDAQFARGQHQAEALAEELLSRVHGPRRLLLRFLLRRLRQLIGSREAPKFHLIRLFATPARELLKPVGAALAADGRVESANDIFFLTLAEARRAVAGADLRAIVEERRRSYEQERARRHIPRVLLSDGTDAEAALIGPSGGALHGSPASPGVVTAAARVIRSPQGARLEPGEILVAPSTDPGWTPLFLTAGGLVMEMGGMMSHGAVVAREYGIPAVVGVAAATERIVTGQRVTVDGFAGSVSVDATEKGNGAP